MPGWVGVAAFFALFVGVGAFITIAVNRVFRRWRARPAILRALATRRGYGFVENPGKPSDLAPIRPLENTANLIRLELPAAVRGRTLDNEFTLFDVFTEQKSGSGNNTNYLRSFQTFISIKSDGRKWPHFEFSAMTHSKPGSMTGMLLEMTASLAESMMQSRGLVHVPIPDRPGYQLFVGDRADGDALRKVLVPLFDNRSAWWIGGLDDALTLQRNVSKSSYEGMLVAEKDLDRFIDEALEIERTVRAAIRP